MQVCHTQGEAFRWADARPGLGLQVIFSPLLSYLCRNSDSSRGPVAEVIGEAVRDLLLALGGMHRQIHRLEVARHPRLRFQPEKGSGLQCSGFGEYAKVQRS